MKCFLLAAALVTMTTPIFAADVGVSVQVNQPGLYGRIDIGNFPPPQVIYPSPVIIQPVPMGMAPQPIYLHVPPGHQKKWHKHCRKYGACGQPVYFVQESWYQNVYVPRYRSHGNYQDNGRGHTQYGEHGHNKDKGKGHGKD